MTASAFSSGQGSAARGIGYSEEICPAPKSGAGGNTVPCTVLYPKIARTLTARGEGSPSVDRGRNIALHVAVGDLTCATLLIRKPADERVFVLQQYFIPRSKVDNIERSQSKEAPYEFWAQRGWLTICETAQVDFTLVTAWFLRMFREYGIWPRWIGYDRALSGYWVPEMESHGFEMVKVAQGPFTWTYPMKDMAAHFRDHRVVYQNNPILRWCLTNTAARSINRSGIESIAPEKIGRSLRIDGVVSLLNAWTVYAKYFDEYMPFVR